MVICFLSCSIENEEKNKREYITTCYKLIEEGSGQPIVGLSILIHYGPNNVLSSQGITNNDGVWCFEHWNDDGPSAILYTYLLENLYFNIPEALPLNGSTNIIELNPKSWIQFHVVNIEPSTVNDRVDVSYFFRINNLRSYGGSRPFEGKDIDTFWYVGVAKGVNISIEWEVKESGVLISTHSDEIIIEDDETFYYLIEY
ncbi:hypothetical protein GCM10022260_04960 [Gaetbulibacter aestuarii]